MTGLIVLRVWFKSCGLWQRLSVLHARFRSCSLWNILDCTTGIPTDFGESKGPAVTVFLFFVFSFEVDFIEGVIFYCRRQFSFCHSLINLRNTECVTLSSIIICRESCTKCLFFNDPLCVILQNKWQCTGFSTAIYGQTPDIQAVR
jgi:hypothetical protein